MNYDRIRKALPVQDNGRPSILRNRPDVAQIVADVVLKRATFADIARKCGVNLDTLSRFRKTFVTPEVERIVLVEFQKDERETVDTEINRAQDAVESGILGVLDEQKNLYRKLSQMVSSGDRELEELLAPMMQLLRDQTKSYEAVLKVYANLRDKTTVMLPLAEHPDVAKLMDALWVVFKLHPAAFDEFKAVAKQKRIPLDVE